MNVEKGCTVIILKFFLVISIVWIVIRIAAALAGHQFEPVTGL